MNFSREPPKTQYHQVYNATEIIGLKQSDNNNVHTPIPRRHDWRASEALFLRLLGYASVGIVPLTLISWLSRSTPDFRHFDVFTSIPLGGSLTLNQAKAIDFVSSAIFAPLFLAMFNYVWFTNARVSIANERRTSTKGTSLYALVEASSISAGSYDLVKLWALCTSRSICLIVFAVLTLSAAVGKSSLSNIIAYEAFKQPLDTAPAQLRFLTGPYMSSYGVEQTTDNATWLASHDQRKDFVQGTTQVLQGIAWQNTTTMLNAGAYITLNVTSWELGQLDSSVIALHNVPAINASIDCQAHTPKSLRLDMWTQTNNNGFTLEFDTGNASGNSHLGWTADVPAGLTVFQDGVGSHTTSLDFLTYSNTGKDESMFVGSMGGVVGSDRNAWINKTLQPFSSPFGQIQARAFDISENGTCAKGHNCSMLVWGIVCTVRQRQGLVNLTRSSADMPWNMSSMSWTADFRVSSSKLQSLATGLGTQSFKPMKAGLGPALTSSAETCNSTSLQDVNNAICSNPGPHHLNYQTLAHNLLWAEMAVQTVAYETGAMNASLSTPAMFITVTSTASVQRYRMTYIPALLFGGLACVFIAALLSASLLAYTANTVSGRQFRYVDSLRLLVDCVANLQHEDISPDVTTWSSDELEDWAKRFMVRYDAHDGRDGSLLSSSVILTAATKNPVVE